jgi:hypothetical protein
MPEVPYRQLSAKSRPFGQGAPVGEDVSRMDDREARMLAGEYRSSNMLRTTNIDVFGSNRIVIDAWTNPA